MICEGGNMIKVFNIGFIILLIGGSIRADGKEYIVCTIGVSLMLIAAIAKKAGEINEKKRRYRRRSYRGNVISFTEYCKQL